MCLCVCSCEELYCTVPRSMFAIKRGGKGGSEKKTTQCVEKVAA